MPDSNDARNSRRSLLKKTALLIGGAPLLGLNRYTTATEAAMKEDDRTDPHELSRSALGAPGVQLYTVRDRMDDVEATLHEVARIGYQEVEFAGYFDHSAKEVKRILEETGLAAPAAHAPLHALENHLSRQIEFAATVGHRYLICAYIPEENRGSLDDYRRFADRFNGWAGECAKAGIQFAFHNHDFEFVEIDGVIPFDILLDRCDPELVKFEIDLFWITKAGKDPLHYFREHPGRFELCHVKDMAPDGSMTEVGAGTLDFASMFEHVETAGLKHFFVEHDEPGDSMASIEKSFDGIQALLNG